MSLHDQIVPTSSKIQIDYNYPMGLLRLLLAISVVLAHLQFIFGYSLIGTRPAVQSFFIISGFYMSLILTEKYVGKKGSYFLFISNRFLRIFPIYWLTLILTITISFPEVVNYLQLHNLLAVVIKNIALFPTLDYFIFQPNSYGGLFVFKPGH